MKRISASAGALLALVLLGSTPAAATMLCSSPIMPFCAEGGEIRTNFVSAEQCRREVAQHLARMKNYKRCLDESVKSAEQEIERLEALLGKTGDSEEDPQS